MAVYVLAALFCWVVWPIRKLQAHLFKYRSVVPQVFKLQWNSKENRLKKLLSTTESNFLL